MCLSFKGAGEVSSQSKVISFAEGLSEVSVDCA